MSWYSSPHSTRTISTRTTSSTMSSHAGHPAAGHVSTITSSPAMVAAAARSSGGGSSGTATGRTLDEVIARIRPATGPTIAPPPAPPGTYYTDHAGHPAAGHVDTIPTGKTWAEVLAQDIRLAEARIAESRSTVERKAAEAELKILQSAEGKNWQAIDSVRKEAALVESQVKAQERSRIETKIAEIFGSVASKPAPQYTEFDPSKIDPVQVPSHAPIDTYGYGVAAPEVLTPPQPSRSQVTITDPVKAATAGMMGMGSLQAASARAQAAQSRHDYQDWLTAQRTWDDLHIAHDKTEQQKHEAWAVEQRAIDQTRATMYADVGLGDPVSRATPWDRSPHSSRDPAPSMAGAHIPDPVRVDQMTMLDRASFELTQAKAQYDRQFTSRLDYADGLVNEKHSVLGAIDLAMKAAAVPIMGPAALRKDSHVGVSGGVGIIEGPGSLAFMTAGLVIASPRLASSAWDMVTTRPAEIPGAVASGGIVMGEHMLAQAATPRGLTRLGTEMALGGAVIGKAGSLISQSRYAAYLGDATLGRVGTAYHAIRHPGEAGVIRAAGATARDAHFIPASTTERSLALVTRTPLDDLVARQTAATIGKHQGTVFGSATAHQNIRIIGRTTTAAEVRSQVGRLAKDIDLRVTSPSGFIDDLWTNVYSKIPGYKRTPTAIETAAGQHVFDVKDAVGQGIPGAASVTPPSTPPGTGFFETIVRRSAAPGVHDIIKTGPYSQEAYAFQLSQRKAAGMYEILRGRAHAGRVKDVYDFVEGHRILAGSIRDSASQAGTVKGALLIRKAARLEARGEYLKGHPAIKPHYDAAAIEVAAGQVSDVQRISQVLKLQPGRIAPAPGGAAGPAPVRIRVSPPTPAPKSTTSLIVGGVSPAISWSVSPAIHSLSPILPSFSPGMSSPSPRSSPAPSQGLPSLSPAGSPSPRIRPASPSASISILPGLISLIPGGSPPGSPLSSPPRSPPSPPSIPPYIPTYSPPGSPPSPPSIPPYIPTYSPPGSPPSPPSIPPSSPPSPLWAPPSSPPPPLIKQRKDERGERRARDLYINYEDIIAPIAQLERAYTDVRDPKIKPVRAVRDFSRMTFGDRDLLKPARTPTLSASARVKKRQPDPLWTRSPKQIDIAGMLSGKPKKRGRR
ncbi:hypothetical protein J2T61_000524 [Methanocalculus sp. AMF5]|uniref:hypothetical protein n=1 Tax=Methanocalculus sp. AMF5 TaxID=1198257 RepID=UPI00209EA595|nr:hypothetical protein [Methanocalculus sp. AMF5]MCP1661860.1 hypothetical protein [Methanocalculus sp. AMF5]